MCGSLGQITNIAVFLRSHAAATIYFAVRFVQLLFEGSVYSKEYSTLFFFNRIVMFSVLLIRVFQVHQIFMHLQNAFNRGAAIWYFNYSNVIKIINFYTRLAHIYSIFVRLFFQEDLGMRLNVMLRMTMWGNGMKSNLQDRFGSTILKYYSPPDIAAVICRPCKLNTCTCQKKYL